MAIDKVAKGAVLSFIRNELLPSIVVVIVVIGFMKQEWEFFIKYDLCFI